MIDKERIVIVVVLGAIYAALFYNCLFVSYCG